MTNAIVMAPQQTVIPVGDGA